MTPFYSRIVTFLLFLTSGHSFLHLCDGFVSQCSTTPTRLPRSVCLSPPIPSRDEVRRCIGIRDQRSYAVLSLSLSPDSNSSNIKRDETSSSLPTLLDPGTKGGVIVLGTLLFIVPFLIYSVLTSTGTLNEEDAGRFVGVGFTIFTSLLWVSTYIFRVATKDMTYVSFLANSSWEHTSNDFVYVKFLFLVYFNVYLFLFSANTPKTISGKAIKRLRKCRHSKEVGRIRGRRSSSHVRGHWARTTGGKRGILIHTQRQIIKITPKYYF